MMRSASIILLASVVLLCACASRPTAAFVPIRHVVVLDLSNPADFREFGNDCFPLFNVPGVVNILTGPAIDTGEPGSIPCSVGVVIDMSTAEECRALADHPVYKSLIAKWTQRSRSVHTVSFGPRCEDPASAGAP